MKDNIIFQLIAANNTRILRQEPLISRPPKTPRDWDGQYTFHEDTASTILHRHRTNDHPFFSLKIELLLWRLARRWLCKEVEVHGIQARVPWVRGLCKCGRTVSLALG